MVQRHLDRLGAAGDLSVFPSANAQGDKLKLSFSKGDKKDCCSDMKKRFLQVYWGERCLGAIVPGFNQIHPGSRKPPEIHLVGHFQALASLKERICSRIPQKVCCSVSPGSKQVWFKIVLSCVSSLSPLQSVESERSKPSNNPYPPIPPETQPQGQCRKSDTESWP